jgi:hypothetical protein
MTIHSQGVNAMKLQNCGAWLACMAIGFALSNLPQPQSTAQEKAIDLGRVKWEYKIEQRLESKELNELGQQGWDLVTVTPPGSGGQSRVFYLRRSVL